MNAIALRRFNRRVASQNRKMRKRGQHIEMTVTEVMILDAKKALKAMGKAAVQKQRQQMHEGRKFDGGKYPKREESYLKYLQRNGRGTAKYINKTGKLWKSYRAYSPRIRKKRFSASYVTVGTPKSQRDKGRGLIGNGYFWHALTPETKRKIQRTLLKTKVFKTIKNRFRR